MNENTKKTNTGDQFPTKKQTTNIEPVLIRVKKKLISFMGHI